MSDNQTLLPTQTTRILLQERKRIITAGLHLSILAMEADRLRRMRMLDLKGRLHRSLRRGRVEVRMVEMCPKPSLEVQSWTIYVKHLNTRCATPSGDHRIASDIEAE